MTAAGAGARWSERVASEGWRFSIAAVGAFLITVPIPFLITGEPVRSAGDFLITFGLGAMIGLDLLCAIYIGLTVWAFAGASAADLAVLVRPQPVPLWVRLLRGGSDGPSAAVQFAGFALAAAAVLPRLDQFVPEGRVRVVLIVLAVAGVLLCWAVLTLSYTVHYVRIHTRDGGLQFPGPEEPTFGDYVYFAVAVGTTLGSTDVQVDGRRMRRVVTGHALLAFAFNTVILALVLSALAA